MAETFSRVVASGSTSVFSVPFPYIDRGHVKVFLDGIETAAFSWQTPGSIALTQSPPAGVYVKVQRVTPGTPLVGFAQGNLDPNDLDVATVQGIFRGQEAADIAADGLQRNTREDGLSASGLLVENLKPGEKPSDAATVGQLSDVVQPVVDAIEGVGADRARAELAAERAEAVGAFVDETTTPWNLDLLSAYEAGFGGTTAVPPGSTPVPAGTDFTQAYENGKA